MLMYHEASSTTTVNMYRPSYTTKFAYTYINIVQMNIKKGEHNWMTELIFNLFIQYNAVFSAVYIILNIHNKEASAQLSGFE